MDEKQQSEFEQLLTHVSCDFPPMWRRLYLNLLEEGFEKNEAFALTKTAVESGTWTILAEIGRNARCQR